MLVWCFPAGPGCVYILFFLSDIRLDWETFNRVQDDCKLVDLLVSYGETFPLKDRDGNEVVGHPPHSCDGLSLPWDKSPSPSTEETSSSPRTCSVSHVASSNWLSESVLPLNAVLSVLW